MGIHPSNGVGRASGGQELQRRLYVAETEFDREMTQIRRAAGDARTLAFPNTVRDVLPDSFWYQHRLRSVTTNEGLEAFGVYDQAAARGMFGGTRV